jgi:hypothetical protein
MIRSVVLPFCLVVTIAPTDVVCLKQNNVSKFPNTY